MKIKDYLSTPEVAKVFNVSRIAVLKWIYAGKIAPIRVGQRYLFTGEMVKRLIDKRKTA